ncbi:MAG: uroporphyrinogen decarboxylase/cobalamine-independent methonine synthase family protein [Armatimonadota bacterium]
MKYKPDWPQAKERLTALWEGQPLDRPCITVTAPRPSAQPWPPTPSPEAQWLDPDYVTQALQAELAGTYWGGEAIPSKLLMGGWAVSHGATPQFSWQTIWHEPIAIDWDAPPTFELNEDDPWLQRYLALYQAVVALAGRDDFLVGRPCLLPANDLLVAIMGNQEFLVSLVDRPEWMRQAILKVAENQATLMKQFAALAAETTDFWYGNAQWMTFWAPEPYMATQSDVSCMLSSDMYDEFVLPEMELLHREFGPLWYHLDGSRAMQHLPRLLSLPYVRVMQFIPEPDMPPNGPDWLDLYRRIQQAGKIVHIQVAPERMEPLVRQLDPRLLCLDTWCANETEANDLLASAVRWTSEG